MTRSEELFARLLTEGVHRIRLRESKTVQIVQDELGYLLGREGGSALEYWRKGHLPPKPDDVAQLAREIVRRGHLEKRWLVRFLESAGYPHSMLLADELFPAEVTAVATVSSTGGATAARPRHNLPQQPTPFVGREHELAEINGLLHNPACRLITLTGPGGIGKTRLAIQAALQAIAAKESPFTHGVYLIPLVAVQSLGRMMATVADALRFSFYSHEDPQAQLLNFLRDKEMLLVLDNMEQLADAAIFLADLLQQAARVKLLVTSRERLRLRAEWLVEVPGLKIPEPPGSGLREAGSDVEGYSAIQLFRQSAQTVHLDFTLSEEETPFVIRICQLVGGLPLGIELAAAWVRLLPCREIAQELAHNLDFLSSTWRDVPERHRSLRAVLDYSWNLLTGSERAAFRALSVFRAGFSRNAAAAVTGTMLPELSALTDKSLLRAYPTGRYQMHELLRLYAGERLAELPEEQQRYRQNHCLYFTHYLHERENDLRGEQLITALQEVKADFENIQAAWEWAIRHHQAEALRDALDSLIIVYEIQNWFQEGSDAFSRAIEALQRQAQRQGFLAQVEAITLGKLLAAKGWFSYRLSQTDEAEALLRQSLSVLQEAGTESEAASSLYGLGTVACTRGEYSQARQYLQQSLAISQANGDRLYVAAALNNLGDVAKLTSDYAAARQYYQESLAILKEAGYSWGVAFSWHNLGEVAFRLGEYEQAQALFGEALALRRAIGYGWGIVSTLTYLGHTACRLRDFDGAQEALQEALLLAQNIRSTPRLLDVLTGIAALLLAEGDLKWAVEILSLAIHHPEVWKETEQRATRLLAEAAAALPPETFAPAQERGRAADYQEISAGLLAGWKGNQGSGRGAKATAPPFFTDP